MNQDLRIQQLEAEVKQLREVIDSVFQYNGQGRTYLKNIIVIDKEAKVGFFGKDPAGKQTLASDTLANLLTALRNLGLIS